MALVFRDRRWTYRGLAAAAEQAAAGLVALGARPGDRVAVFARNSDMYAITWLATQLLAAVHVPVNFMLTAREVAYVIEHSGASLAFSDAELWPTLREAVSQTSSEVTAGVLERDDGAASDAVVLHEAWSSEPIDEPVISADTISQIAYTSGTESAPKGAMLTHAGLLTQYVSCIVAGEYRQEDRFLHALPMYHCAQMHCFLMPALYLGAAGVIVGGASPRLLIETIVEHDLTSLFAPPTVWIGLLQEPDFERVGATLTKGYYGAATMPVQTIRSLTDRLPQVRLWNYYGQTELGPLATCLGPEEQLTRIGSAGRPVLNVQTRVVAPDGSDVAVGDVGEIVHRSPQVTAGYYRDAEKTREAFDGSWFHSGDLATVDPEGYITIVDRKKDMINTGGENVSSREIEEVLYQHPGVAEVAVIGAPDEKWGEAVHAIVVPAAGAQIDEDALRDFAAGQLARFKIPKAFSFRDSLPKNPSGKILKRELRGDSRNDIARH